MLVGIGSGAGLAALLLLGVGGLPGVVGDGVLLSLALWVGFKAQPVVDIEREKAPSTALAEMPMVSLDSAGSAKAGVLLAIRKMSSVTGWTGNCRRCAGSGVVRAGQALAKIARHFCSSRPPNSASNSAAVNTSSLTTEASLRSHRSVL